MRTMPAILYGEHCLWLKGGDLLQKHRGGLVCCLSDKVVATTADCPLVLYQGLLRQKDMVCKNSFRAYWAYWAYSAL